MIPDTDFLKLHVDADGRVWFADGEHTPVCSGADAAEFATELRRREPLYVRMLGTHANARLLSQLHAWCRRRGGRVEVATPRLCRSEAELASPEMVLLRVRQSRLPSVLGGWHAMTEIDYLTYTLIAELSQSRQYDARVESLLQRHPLWHDLQFIHDVRPEWAAWFLSFVVDPRWHVDREHPDRTARLLNYMGLSMRVQRRVGDEPRRTGATSRCRATLLTWKGGAEPPDDVVADNPRCFLRRIAAARPGVKGDLRASSKFVKYVRYSWMQATVAGTHQDHAAFLPEMFFKTQAEIDAYYAHAAARPTRFDSASGHG